MLRPLLITASSLLQNPIKNISGLASKLNKHGKLHHFHRSVALFFPFVTPTHYNY